MSLAETRTQGIKDIKLYLTGSRRTFLFDPSQFSRGFAEELTRRIAARNKSSKDMLGKIEIAASAFFGLRADTGMNQATFAQLSGIPTETVVLLEAGLGRPDEYRDVSDKVKGSGPQRTGSSPVRPTPLVRL